MQILFRDLQYQKSEGRMLILYHHGQTRRRHRITLCVVLYDDFVDFTRQMRQNGQKQVFCQSLKYQLDIHPSINFLTEGTHNQEDLFVSNVTHYFQVIYP